MYNYRELQPDHCEFVPIMGVEDISEGERVFVEIGEHPIVIFNIAGQLFAIADVCSHDDGPVGEGELDGNEIICPRHGGRFSVINGKALSLPAVMDIPAYPVRIIEGQVEIGIPLEVS